MKEVSNWDLPPVITSKKTARLICLISLPNMLLSNFINWSEFSFFVFPCFNYNKGYKYNCGAQPCNDFGAVDPAAVIIYQESCECTYVTSKHSANVCNEPIVFVNDLSPETINAF